MFPATIIRQPKKKRGCSSSRNSCGLESGRRLRVARAMILLQFLACDYTSVPPFSSPGLILPVRK